MNGNDFMAWVLRSPLHGMLSNDMMLITVAGRKTGRKYTTPVGYYEEDGYLWVITNRDRTWWRNVRNGANVSLLLKGKTVHAFAKAELKEDIVEKCMFEYIRHVPVAAKLLGIRMENKIPNAGDIVRIAKEKLFVRVRLY